MRAELKEFKDTAGKVFIAVIWVHADHTNPAEMNEAQVRLINYLSTYIGRRGHNLYIHTEMDTVSAIVSIDLNNYLGSTIQI